MANISKEEREAREKAKEVEKPVVKKEVVKEPYWKTRGK